MAHLAVTRREENKECIRLRLINLDAFERISITLKSGSESNFVKLWHRVYPDKPPLTFHGEDADTLAQEIISQYLAQPQVNELDVVMPDADLEEAKAEGSDDD